MNQAKAVSNTSLRADFIKENRVNLINERLQQEGSL